MESSYWIQMYKLGAASRADRPAVDLMGPWYKKTIWPDIWWNLNIQLTYYPDVKPVEADPGKCNYFGSGHAVALENAKKKKK